MNRTLFAVVFALLGGAIASHANAQECTRPTDPAGAADYAYGSATVESFGTDTVLVWFTREGEHAVNTHSTRTDGVPDDVAEVAQVTTDALQSYAMMGFHAPIADSTNTACGSNGGDGRLDVYLVQMVGADGLTNAENGRCTLSGQASSCAAFILAKSDFSTYYDTASIGIHTVLPHETFHVIQDAYDTNLDRFWAEGTAQWAAKTLDPSLTDLERFLPAFFDEASRSLDAPATGVTADFLYGAAIWPVFLTQRHGETFVRSVLAQEALAGAHALDATNTVLESEMPAGSMASEFPLFAAWNAATGARADAHGYTNGAHYPSVMLSEIHSGTAQGITSGYATYYYHTTTTSPATVTLDTNATRNAGLLVPLENGRANLEAAAPLPAQLDGEGIVVVSGITAHKTDAPFTVHVAAIDTTDAGENADGGVVTPPPSKSGCTVSAGNRPLKWADFAFAAVLASVVMRARTRIKRRR